MSDTDRMAMRYRREDTYGDPGSGPLSTLAITSETLTTDFAVTESETVVGDRQVRDLIRTGRQSQGDLNFELLHGNIDDLLPGALAVDDWEGSPTPNVLVNSDDLVSYAFEKDFQDPAFLYAFTGCRVGGFGLNLPLSERITGSLSVMGRGGVFASGGASIGTGDPAAAVETEPMVTLETLTIEEGGISPAVDVLTGFSFQLTNNLRAHRVLGSIDLRNIRLGTFRVTGTLEAYFEDLRFIETLLDDAPSDFEITTEDSDGNSYTFVFPRFKFTRLQGPANSGRSRDVMKTLEWTAVRDPSTGITMRVERASA